MVAPKAGGRVRSGGAWHGESRMRLIITGLWGQLERATSEEIEALEQSAAKGNWTNGRGPTEALAARLGHPSG
jgi:hypothetical protein